jgi:hypothetical protein
MGIKVEGSIEITINGTKLTLSLEEAKDLQAKLDSAIPKQWAYWSTPYDQPSWWWWHGQQPYTICQTDSNANHAVEDHGISVSYNGIEGVKVQGCRIC